jgi:type III restriction enzyme
MEENTIANAQTATQAISNNPSEFQVAQIAIAALNQLQHSPSTAPTSKALLNNAVQQQLITSVTEQLKAGQQSLPNDQEPIDIAEIVKKATNLMVQQTIDIPRIVVVPKGDVSYGYRPFALNLTGLNLQPSTRDIVIQNLRTNKQEFMNSQIGLTEQLPEDYIVHALIDYDDICYDEHADLIYDLASQVVQHLNSYLSEDEVNNVLNNNRQLIAKNVYTQMTENFWEKADDYEVEIRSGFTPLKQCAYTVSENQPVHSYRDTVLDKSKIKQLLFGNFSKCLYNYQKFDSDTERRFSIILERDSQKWFKPAKGQFQIYYKDGIDHPEYIPDFVTETEDAILMIETKSQAEMTDKKVESKANAAIKWCNNASDYCIKNGGKHWKYLLIPHDEIKENFKLTDYVEKFSRKI